MAQSQRSHAVRVCDPLDARISRSRDSTAEDDKDRSGGELGQVQAHLVHLSMFGAVGQNAVALPGERLTRYLSVSAGYMALLAGYAGAALLLLR